MNEREINEEQEREIKEIEEIKQELEELQDQRQIEEGGEEAGELSVGSGYCEQKLRKQGKQKTKNRYPKNSYLSLLRCICG